VAVLDITMPNLNGIEAARQIIAKQPNVAVVILSMHSDEGYVLRALKAGRARVSAEGSPEADFIQAVRSVSEGKPTSVRR
jgi:DNA-binding NarL/FixJ family response regulator